MSPNKAVVLAIATVVLFSGCNKLVEDALSVSEAEGNAQQVGDVLASIDESGGSSGAYALNGMDTQKKLFARYVPSVGKRDPLLQNLILPKAFAANCLLSNTWGTCTNNVITRNFNDCTLSGATFSGSITLTFNDGAVNNVCALDADSNTITRVPAFTITGPQGGVYSVSKTGSVGQRITRTSNGAYTFTNDGIRRVITYNGLTLFDATTTTTSALGISGASRNGRVVNGGTLRVTNNKTGVTCDYTPSSLTYSSSCNCPVSGSLSGTCSDGRSTSLNITGCGSGNLTLGTETDSVSMDRCSSI